MSWDLSAPFQDDENVFKISLLPFGIGWFLCTNLAWSIFIPIQYLRWQSQLCANIWRPKHLIMSPHVLYINSWNKFVNINIIWAATIQPCHYQANWTASLGDKGSTEADYETLINTIANFSHCSVYLVFNSGVILLRFYWKDISRYSSYIPAHIKLRMCKTNSNILWMPRASIYFLMQLYFRNQCLLETVNLDQDGCCYYRVAVTSKESVTSLII